MITIVVCSVNNSLFKALAANIQETIGLPYEIIKVDNSTNAYSICEAYNKGASTAKYPYLCFVHEDVLFKTNGWGQNVIDHFAADEETGMIGIAGSVYKAKMTSGWGQSEDGWLEPKRMNIVQHYKQTERQAKHIYFNPFNEVRSRVVAIDGVLMIAKKDVWEKNKFDDKLLSGFHGYDLDFSFQVFQSKKIFVVYDILIDHFSGGNFDSAYLEEIAKVHKKWQQHLPLTVEQCEANEVVYANGWKRLRKNMNVLIDGGYNLSSLVNKYNLFFSQLDNTPNSLKLYQNYISELVKFVRIYYRQKSSAA
jgi:hypothetical protein